MNDKIYLVSHGAYSDYCVDCVFTKESDAEEYARRYNADYNVGKYGEFHVEEVDLNPEIPTIVSCVRVRMYDDGHGDEVPKVGECLPSSIGFHGYSYTYRDNRKRLNYWVNPDIYC